MTAVGRSTIEETKKDVESFEVPSGGYCRVIYGDTDSVMALYPNGSSQSLEALFSCGSALAEAITEKTGLVLEMEEVFTRMVLWKKKRYAALAVASPTAEPHTVLKGVEIVRKDACELARQSGKEIMDALLMKGDLPGAVKAACRGLIKVGQAPPPYDILALSKTLRADYKDPDALYHVEVAKRKALRGAGIARSGDRISCIVIASQVARVVDKIEDLDFAKENGLLFVLSVGTAMKPRSVRPPPFSLVCVYNLRSSRRHGLLRGHVEQAVHEITGDTTSDISPGPPVETPTVYGVHRARGASTYEQSSHNLRPFHEPVEKRSQDQRLLRESVARSRGELPLSRTILPGEGGGRRGFPGTGKSCEEGEGMRN